MHFDDSQNNITENIFFNQMDSQLCGSVSLINFLLIFSFIFSIIFPIRLNYIFDIKIRLQICRIDLTGITVLTIEFLIDFFLRVFRTTYQTRHDIVDKKSFLIGTVSVNKVLRDTKTIPHGQRNSLYREIVLSV